MTTSTGSQQARKLHWALSHSGRYRMRISRLRDEVKLLEPPCPEECWDAKHENPILTCPSGEHLGVLLAHKFEYGALPYWRRLSPYHEKELVWLEAFWRVVPFMEVMLKEKGGVQKDRLELLPGSQAGANDEHRGFLGERSEGL